MRYPILFFLFFTGCVSSPLAITGRSVVIAPTSQGETTGTGLVVGKTIIETDTRMLFGLIRVTGHWETRRGTRREHKVFVIDTINRAENE